MKDEDFTIVSMKSPFVLGHWSKAPENIPPYVIIDRRTNEPVEYGFNEEQMEDNLLTWKAQDIFINNPQLIQEIEKDLGINLTDD